MEDWHIERAEFEILIGISLRDIVLHDTVKVESSMKSKKKYTLDSTFADIKSEPVAQN